MTNIHQKLAFVDGLVNEVDKGERQKDGVPASVHLESAEEARRRQQRTSSEQMVEALEKEQRSLAYRNDNLTAQI